MLPIFLHSFISCNTKYLSTTFLSTVTSPKGYQLDIWLLILLIMDCVPMFMSLYHTVQYIAQSHSDSWRYDPNSVFWSLTSAMRLVYINILLAKYKNICTQVNKILFYVQILVSSISTQHNHNAICRWLFNQTHVYFGYVYFNCNTVASLDRIQSLLYQIMIYIYTIFLIKNSVKLLSLKIGFFP